MEIRERVEFLAIPAVVVVVGVLFIVFDAAEVGRWAWLLVGALGLALASGLAMHLLRQPGRRPRRDAPRHGRAALQDGVRRVLLILDATCPRTTLWQLVGAEAATTPTEVLVVAPALGSRAARLTGDERAYAEATRRLDTSLRALYDMGVDASGRLGSHDPIQAADDGLREFPANEVVFAIHAAERANWLERDADTVARERYDVPVRSVVIGGGARGV